MWLSRFWVLLGIVGVMAGCGGEPVAPEPVEPTPGLTAFVGARIIDGTGNAAIENGVLVVRDGRLEVETPKRNSKPKSSGAWAAGRGRWKCCSCGTWTRDPAHRACLACRKLENQI